MLKRNKCSNEGCFGGMGSGKTLYGDGNCIRQVCPTVSNFGGFGSCERQPTKYGFSGAPYYGNIGKGFNGMGFIDDEDEDGEETFEEGFITGTIITSVVLLAILYIVKRIKSR